MQFVCWLWCQHLLSFISILYPAPTPPFICKCRHNVNSSACSADNVAAVSGFAHSIRRTNRYRIKRNGIYSREKNFSNSNNQKNIVCVLCRYYIFLFRRKKLFCTTPVTMDWSSHKTLSCVSRIVKCGFWLLLLCLLGRSVYSVFGLSGMSYYCK